MLPGTGPSNFPADRRRRIAMLSGSVLLVALAACQRAGPPPDEAMLIDVPVGFSGEGTAPLAERWWHSFEDPQLDRLIESALGANFDLAAAWQRLRAARAEAERQGAARWPQLDAEAEARAVTSEDDAGRRNDDETITVGLAASYEVDLWGRIDALADAEGFRAAAARDAYRTAAISLTAEIASAWYALAEARLQQRLIGDQVATNEQVLRLLRERFGGGLVRSADLIRQQQLVEATREELTIVDLRADSLAHRLAVLLGRAPQMVAFEGMPAALPELPPPPATGLPAELVERRPDVRSARWQLAAANRDLAAAIADQYPRLTLTAGVSTTQDDAADLFDNWLAEIAANLIAPLVDGGARRAAVRRQQAEETERLHTYGQAVLEAFQEVEDALAAEHHRRAQLASIERQLELARQARDRLREEYLGGVSDYLDVLSALTVEQRLERDLLDVRQQLIDDRIALYRSLAGDFMTPLEATARAEATSDSTTTEANP